MSYCPIERKRYGKVPGFGQSRVVKFVLLISVMALNMVLKSLWKLNIYTWVKILIWIILFSAHLTYALPADLYAFSSEQDSQRFLNLTKTFRCVVCQNQSLADSDTTLAKDLRHKIYQMLNGNKSDDEIRQYLVSRYGEFILFSPLVKPVTLVLWGFPAILLTFILGGFWLWRRSRPQ